MSPIQERHGLPPAVGILNQEIRPRSASDARGACHESSRYTLNDAIDQGPDRGGPAFAGDPDRSAGSEACKALPDQTCATGRELTATGKVRRPAADAPEAAVLRREVPHIGGCAPLLAPGATPRGLHAGLVGPSASAGPWLVRSLRSDRARPGLRRAARFSAADPASRGRCGRTRRYPTSGLTLDRTCRPIAPRAQTRKFPWSFPGYVLLRRQPRGLHA